VPFKDPLVRRGYMKLYMQDYRRGIRRRVNPDKPLLNLDRRKNKPLVKPRIKPVRPVVKPPSTPRGSYGAVRVGYFR